MMGYTHLVTGLAAAFAITQPKTANEYICAAIGGAIGGIICDIEVRSDKRTRDALCSRTAVVIIVALALLFGRFMNAEIYAHIFTMDRYRLVKGLAIFVVCCLCGRFTSHRTFTHSFLYIAILAFSVDLISPDLVIPLLSGALSHLALDVMNKKPIRLFFPIRGGLCLKWFYADGIANKALFVINLMVLVGVVMCSTIFVSIASS